MDVKQLPPATCEPVFLVMSEVRESFRFATLRENRRVVDGGAGRQEEIENYHQVLDDMAMCRATPAVRAFCLDLSCSQARSLTFLCRLWIAAFLKAASQRSALRTHPDRFAASAAQNTACYVDSCVFENLCLRAA